MLLETGAVVDQTDYGGGYVEKSLMLAMGVGNYNSYIDSSVDYL